MQKNYIVLKTAYIFLSANISESNESGKREKAVVMKE